MVACVYKFLYGGFLGGFMWSIVDLERRADSGMVIAAHWKLTAGEWPRTVHLQGAVMLPPKDPMNKSFIPFENLTEDVILNWVKAQLGKEQVLELETSVQRQLENLNNPDIVKGLPWWII